MSALAKQPIKKKKKRVMLRVIKGGLVPADPWAASELRNKGYKVGDLIGADLSKLRNPKFNRLVHRIGQLCVANIDEFRYSDAHDVLKRLQLEGKIRVPSSYLSAFVRARMTFKHQCVYDPRTKVSVEGTTLPSAERVTRPSSFDRNSLI